MVKNANESAHPEQETLIALFEELLLFGTSKKLERKEVKKFIDGLIHSLEKEENKNFTLLKALIKFLVIVPTTSQLGYKVVLEQMRDAFERSLKVLNEENNQNKNNLNHNVGLKLEKEIHHRGRKNKP